mgnify:FL=1|tara:strand:+ start:1223 stop:2527 length:1305 start_codon:yes stop_codon:yes gene_type:complete
MAIEEILIPDIGDFDNVEIIEIMVSVGDKIEKEDSIITVESDKASMDIPSIQNGVVKEIKVSVGDKVKEGNIIGLLDSIEITKEIVKETIPIKEPKKITSQASMPASMPPAKIQPKTNPLPIGESSLNAGDKSNHASPSIRKFARNLGVNLSFVHGSGPKNRILIEDIEIYVKQELRKPRTESMGSQFAPIPMPNIDFSKFGKTEKKALSKIKKISGANLHRNWVTAPHVTQFDNTDITDLDVLRKSMQKEVSLNNTKVTLLAFVIKATVEALKAYPTFNSSLSPDGDMLILKNYFNIGFACDTPDGLVVPVVKDADKKNIIQIANDLSQLSEKARERKLKMDQMEGGCFTISSLGGIGGTKFTPIINCPEVAILGLSRASMQPVYNKESGKFDPRLILPISLSYDHRVVDGADGARFTSHLSMLLSDVNKINI